MVNIGICGNCSLDTLATALNQTMPTANITVGLNDNFQEELHNPFGDFLTLDACVLALDWRLLVPAIYVWAYNDDPALVRQAWTSQCAKMVDLIRAFRSHSGAKLIIFSPVSDWTGPLGFQTRLLQPSPHELSHEFQQCFNQACRQLPSVYPVDLEEIAGIMGRASFYHAKTGNQPGGITTAGYQRISQYLQKMCVQFERYPLKCLVLDCDDTLWGGIAGEDGFDHIILDTTGAGRPFYDFQAEIVRLHRQGVILTICSKNNTCDVLDIMERHPAMLIRPSMVSCFRVNWEDKPNSIASAAAELNIGLQSMMFIDDNPAERAMVRSALPEVTVFDLPLNPLHYAPALKECSRFWPVELTREDAQKSEHYAGNKIRAAAAAQNPHIETFLAQSNIRVTFQPATPEQMPRVVQLINKTNQFNLSGKRVTAAELDALLKMDGAACFCMSMTDTYGDYGIMAAAIMIQEEIESLVMSCRAFGKRAEHAFLICLMNTCKERGYSSVFGRYCATARNSMVRDFYRDGGFSLKQHGDGTEIWQFDLSQPVPTPVAWITVSQL